MREIDAAMVDPVPGAALRAAVTLGIADHLAVGVSRVGALAGFAGCNEEALGRLLRYLTVRGIFDQVGRDQYALTPAGELLQSNHPLRLCESLKSGGAVARFDYVVTETLVEAIRTGRSTYRSVYGCDLYEDLSRRPDLAESFGAIREHLSDGFADMLADSIEWPEAGVIVDVGGGTGALLRCILLRNPHLTGVVVDLEHHRAGFRRLMQQSGLEDRARFNAESFFDCLPADGARYIMCNVLYNWGDVAVSKLLLRCAGVIRNSPTSRLVVIEAVLDGDLRSEALLAQDLRLLVLVGGRHRFEYEFESLASEAGLGLDRSIRTASGLQVMNFGYDEAAG